MMDRRTFIGTVVGGIVAIAFLKDLEAKTEKMPTMFFGYGSPMNAVQKNHL